MADNRFSDLGEDGYIDIRELDFEYDGVDKVLDFSAPEPEGEMPEVAEVPEPMDSKPPAGKSKKRKEQKAKRAGKSKWSRKRKAGGCMAAVLCILVAVFVYASFLDGRPHKIKVLSMVDFTSALDSVEEQILLDKVYRWDSSCLGVVNHDGPFPVYESSFIDDPFPPYAVSYIVESYGADSLYTMAENFREAFAECGDDLTLDETYKVKKKLDSKRELEELKETFLLKFWSYGDYDIEKAYVITVYTKVKGSEGSTTLKDDYLFYYSDSEWNIILVRDLADFGL